jgi:hypothetical protein
MPTVEGVSEEINMSNVMHGKIHGRTIELAEDPGLAEGQEVEVQVKVIPGPPPWGDGLRRCAGSLANDWTDEDDRILAAIHKERKNDTRREIPE